MMSKKLPPVIQPMVQVLTASPFVTRFALGVSTTHPERIRGQVKVVARQAIRMHLEAGLLARLRQRLQKIPPVHFIEVDVLLAIAAAHDVVAGRPHGKLPETNRPVGGY
jgi:hypothetical protein